MNGEQHNTAIGLDPVERAAETNRGICKSFLEPLTALSSCSTILGSNRKADRASYTMFAKESITLTKETSKAENRQTVE